MPKLARELSDAAVRKLRHGKVRGGAKGSARSAKPKGTPCPTYHAVGGVSGLLLVCKPPVDGQDIGARSWVLRTKVGDKRRDIGLGGYPDVSLSTARERARVAKDKIRVGVDPVAERKALRSALIAEQAKLVTFADVAREYIAKKSKELTNAKNIYKLNQQIETYANPFIGRLVVGDIERAHIVKMLEPIWTDKHETARRVRAHTESVLDLAGVKGLRSGDNPARWKGNLELSFPAGHKVANRKHRPALAVDELPAFWADLRSKDSMGAKALQFSILTAARPGEALEATWNEIDLVANVWTIPAERMKAKRNHRVPLTAEAVKLLNSLPRISDAVFPNSKGKPISNVMPSKVIEALHTTKCETDRVGYVDKVQHGERVTAHGFRSTFRTWVQEHTSYPEEVAELALAHVNSDATRAAYARSELIDKRRHLMEDWEYFVFNGHALKKAEVVSIGGRR